jgi:hypothetical protein
VAGVLAVREDELSGAAVRRMTRRATAARADITLLARMGDLWGSLVSIAIGVGVLAGWVASLRERISLADAPVTTATLASGLSATIAVVVAVAGLVLVLDRLGPVSSTPAAGAWWLPLPAGRRGLLISELRRIAVAVAATGAVLGLPVVAGLSPAPSVAGVLTGALLVGGAAAAVVGATALHQTRSRSGRLAPVAGAVAVSAAAAGAAGGTEAALTGGSVVPGLPAPPSWVWVGMALAALPLLAAAVAGLDRLGTAELRTLGATSEYAAGSVVTLDTRELGRALAARTQRTPRRGRRFARVRGGARALVAADATAVLRAPWQLGQLLLAVAVPVLVARTEGLGALPVAVYAACMGGWVLAAVAAGHPARLAHVTPAIDRVLPLSAAAVVLVRAAVPLVLTTVVTGLTGVLLGVGSGSPFFWTALCAATAPAWAAASLRGALRPEIDWSGPVVSTPMGVVPAGIGFSFVRGVDVGVLGSLPLAAALFLGVTGTTLVLVQLLWATAFGAGALALVARRRTRAD